MLERMESTIRSTMTVSLMSETVSISMRIEPDRMCTGIAFRVSEQAGMKLRIRLPMLREISIESFTVARSKHRIRETSVTGILKETRLPMIFFRINALVQRSRSFKSAKSVSRSMEKLW